MDAIKIHHKLREHTGRGKWGRRKLQALTLNKPCKIKLGVYTNYLAVFAAHDVEAESHAALVNHNRSRLSGRFKDDFFFDLEQRQRRAYLVMSS